MGSNMDDTKFTIDTSCLTDYSFSNMQNIDTSALDDTFLSSDIDTEESHYNLWQTINTKLKTRGFNEIDTDRVLNLDCHTTKQFSSVIIKLIRENDKKQSALHELKFTNSKLTEDVARQKELSLRSQANLRDLETLLDKHKIKMKDLEDTQAVEIRSVSNKLYQLQDEHQAVRGKCKQLEIVNKNLKDENERSQRKIIALQETENKRKEASNKVFQNFRARPARTQSASDQRWISMIESFQDEIDELKGKLKRARNSDDNSSGALDQLKRKYDQLESELQDANNTVSRLESSRQLSSFRYDSKGPFAKGDCNDEEFDISKSEDIQHMTLFSARKYLESFCNYLNLTDLSEVIPKLRILSEKNNKYLKLKKFCDNVMDITDSTGVPNNMTFGNKRGQKSYSQSLDTLQVWVDQMLQIKQLYRSINKLIATFLPNQKILPPTDDVTVVDLKNYVDGFTRENQSELNDMYGGTIAHSDVKSLRDIVRHFQNLFEVETIAGVYPRMNDVYARVGEANNILSAIKDMLGLDNRASAKTVIGAVEAVCRQLNTKTYDQLKLMLSVDDLESVIRKLRQHEEFFPLFDEMVTKLFEVLEVNSIERIVPAVKTLHVLARQR